MNYHLEPADATIDESLDAFFYGVSNPSRKDQRQIDRAVRREFARNFSRQGSAAGTWRRLSPWTVDERIRLGYNGRRPKLIRTGDYSASFTGENDSDHVLEYNRTERGFELEIGSQDWRSEWLEFGTRDGRIPARPVANLGRQATSNVFDVVDDVIGRLWRTQVGSR